MLFIIFSMLVFFSFFWFGPFSSWWRSTSASIFWTFIFILLLFFIVFWSRSTFITWSRPWVIIFLRYQPQYRFSLWRRSGTMRMRRMLRWVFYRFSLTFIWLLFSFKIDFHFIRDNIYINPIFYVWIMFRLSFNCNKLISFYAYYLFYELNHPLDLK